MSLFSLSTICVHVRYVSGDEQHSDLCLIADLSPEGGQRRRPTEVAERPRIRETQGDQAGRIRYAHSPIRLP